MGESLTIIHEGMCSGSGLKEVGQELGVMFHKANGEYNPESIQAGNVAFSSLMEDGSMIGYGVYQSGPANQASSYDPNTLVLISTP